jgi:dolichol-phosphate mannosyltransferase
VGGYTSASNSFCDDVTLARYIASQGFKVGFLDGAKVLKVRMYEGAKETWKEWGRSLDLKDASSSAQLWSDLWLLFAVQGLPVLVVPACFLISSHSLLLWLNVFLLVIRFAMLLAIAPSYHRKNAQGGWLFWFSPLADPIAVLRIFLSAFHTPREWRGRKYN